MTYILSLALPYLRSLSSYCRKLLHPNIINRVFADSFNLSRQIISQTILINFYSQIAFITRGACESKDLVCGRFL
jgi:hypothetical protein